MTLMGICERCAEEKPIHVPHERRRLTRGPDGAKLCGRHAREAWDEAVRSPSEIDSKIEELRKHDDYPPRKRGSDKRREHGAWIKALLWVRGSGMEEP